MLELFRFRPRGDEPRYRFHAVPLSQAARIGDPPLISALHFYRVRMDAAAG